MNRSICLRIYEDKTTARTGWSVRGPVEIKEDKRKNLLSGELGVGLLLSEGDALSDVVLEIGGHSTREGREDGQSLAERELGVLERLVKGSENGLRARRKKASQREQRRS
jgi:hypothetical protein